MGWGPIEVGRSNGEQDANDGKTITLNGKKYVEGFGVHAGSDMRFSLKGAGASCNRFTTDIGVDDEVGNRGSVIFQVFLDGVKAYDSGTMKGTSVTKSIDLSIAGKRELRLVVTDAGDGLAYDHADWASPQINCQVSRTSGRLDVSYGVNGILNVGGGYDAVQEPSGTFLIVDQDESFALGDFVLKRKFPDGRSAKVSTDLGGKDEAYALLRQPDGKIVMAGGSSSNKFSLAVVRYNADLSLDASFGSGGKVTTPVPLDITLDFNNPRIDKVALTPDGKIVVGGVVSRDETGNGNGYPEDLVLSRYLPNGKIDNSFGKNGILIITTNQLDNDSPLYRFDRPNSIVTQPDGKILLALFTSREKVNDLFRIARLNIDGSFDKSFGESGSGIVTLGQGTANNVALLPNNEILVGGTIGSGPPVPALVRFSPSGRVVTVAKFPFDCIKKADDFGDLKDFRVQTNGKILISASIGCNPAQGVIPLYVLARLKPDLSLDTTFGDDGIGDDFSVGRFIQYSDNEIFIYDNGNGITRFFP